MDEEFAWPAVLMLAGAAVWIALVIWQMIYHRRPGLPSWIGSGLCLGAGGLVLVSGFG